MRKVVSGEEGCSFCSGKDMVDSFDSGRRDGSV